MEEVMLDHTNAIGSEISDYAILPLFYKKNGYQYEQVFREGNIAVYSQKSEGIIHAFEVFKIRKQKATDWGEVHYEAKERVPSSEEWGNNAFTVYTLDKAMDKVFIIKEAIQNRLINGNNK